MQKVITCPAGRKRHLEVLMQHLLKNRSEFDTIEFWVNTNVPEDIDYLHYLENQYDFVSLIHLTTEKNWIWTIGDFFPQAIDENKVYLRFDDDICYIHKGSIATMFETRIEDTESLLLYGNIVNNAIISHLHMRYGILESPYRFNYDCMDETGWKNPKAAEEIHRNFLKKHALGKLEEYYMPNWNLLYHERVSANVISWRGIDFKQFGGISYGHEEAYLSEVKTKELNKTSKIVGNTLFCHYSFFSQAEYLDRTDIFDKYKSIAFSGTI